MGGDLDSQSTLAFFKATTTTKQVVKPMPVVIFKQTKEQRTVTKKREIERESVWVCVSNHMRRLDSIGARLVCLLNLFISQ